MNKEALLSFIAKAHRNTYAAPKEVKKQYKCKDSILPGHTDYDFCEGDFRYHDSYAGWKNPPGKEVVFYKDKPVWQMSYQGKAADTMSEDFIEQVYEFLKKALMSFDENMPFRGPEKFVEGEFVYEFKTEGDLEYFKGREVVLFNDKEVFFQDVMGSLIF